MSLSSLIFRLTIFYIISLSFGEIWLLDKIGFDEVSTEHVNSSTNSSIGWIKMMSCTESYNAANSVFTFSHSDYDLDLQSYAISIKIVPSGGKSNPNYASYAVIAKPCSNPVIALNNNLELSVTIDVNTLYMIGLPDINNWIGTITARNRLTASCWNSQSIPNNTMPRSYEAAIYHACGNGGGIHILIPQSICAWSTSSLGQDIEIYYGFDTDKEKYCNSQQYVNIEVYSWGKEQTLLFNQGLSFIKVNGGYLKTKMIESAKFDIVINLEVNYNMSKMLI